MLRSVIYCRVSTKEQTKNLSLPSQELACRNYCESRGYDVVKLFVEEGESAKTADRTQFKKLLEFCRDRQQRVDMVVVYSLNRFSRDQLTHVTIRALLSKLNITLRSVTEPIDDTSTGKLMEGIISCFAQFDNDQKAERTVVGMKAALENGNWPFPVPLGYSKRPGESGHSRIEVDPERGPLIKQAFELFATGAYEREQVRKIVTSAGLRTKAGNKLSGQSFCNLLKNPFYAGKLVVGGWQIESRGAFESLVSQSTFDLVQAIVSGKKPTLKPRLRTHPDFPLRHFLGCGRCGRPLTGSWTKGRNRHYAYYHCANNNCQSGNFPKIDVEKKFVELIEALQPKPEYMNLFREIVLDVWRQRQSATIEASKSLEKNLERLKIKRLRVSDAFIHERSIDKSVYDDQLAHVNEEIALTELEIHESKLEALDLEAALNFATRALSNAAQFWMNCSLDQKQRFQQILFPEGLRFDGQGFGTVTTCIAFRYLEGISSGKSSLASRTGVEPVSPP